MKGYWGMCVLLGLVLMVFATPVLFAVLAEVFRFIGITSVVIACLAAGIASFFYFAGCIYGLSRLVHGDGKHD